MVSYDSIKIEDKASPALCRKISQVERKQDLLRLLYELQIYESLKAELEQGVAEISSKPWLKEVCESEHVTLVHADYWKLLKRVAELAKRRLPKKLYDKPLDVVQEARVFGALCALDWFLSEENDRLASYLHSTAQNNAPEKIPTTRPSFLGTLRSLTRALHQMFSAVKLSS